ncbi:CBS domain-containing protein [Spongiactinospora gelatinilytica]|uniref:CBS domain-containing protein n=1 Tax=Spongiactinospora gelatinilytica TaxID=2666298 RepID=A0A2W2HWY1_9ACTN|nr:CBS domain-containing protein [Spongiactinospora gelatinilytica]PZG54298.1 CBS domain-containing protein [Spongiactinospora gelatinilytica]
MGTAQSATTVKDVMHPGARCIEAHETLDRAAQLMRELGVGALPISDDGRRLRGIITDRDIVVGCIAAGRDPANTRAGDLAAGLVWVGSDATIDEALAKMEEHQIRRLPVLEDDQIIGMISEADLARHLPPDKLAELVSRIYAPS